MLEDSSDILEWTSDHVGAWLESKGHEMYSKLLCEVHKIDGVGLISLTENDLRSPPINIQVLGDIKRIIYDVETLKADNAVALKYVEYKVEKMGSRQYLHELDKDKDVNSEEIPSSCTKKQKTRLVLVKEIFSMTPENFNLQKYFLPELVKTMVAALYLVVVSWLLSFVMVIVHDRVPDMKKYPPLPDIFLDNIPVLPWAFKLSEICGTVLMVMWVTTCIFHKYRTILLRRFFALLGTAYLLRSITMLITSLSVPGAHIECSPRSHMKRTFAEKVQDAYIIWKGAGLSIQGVKTCGDYLFSGHTTAVTFLNFFITEYTPNKFKILHGTAWLLNILAIVCILASHEHYSIDVFIAFYITSRLFLYYHSLANNQALLQRDSHRVKIWFPFFGYLESSMITRVPNEFDGPLDLVKFTVQAAKSLEARLKSLIR